MDQTSMTIKREYFAAVVAGTKKNEYRRRTKYWKARIEKLRCPFRLELRNGYSKQAPIAWVVIDKVAKTSDGYYAAHIAKVAKTIRWPLK
jgi:hypothetical protein